jgi:hypothetical protein
MKEGLEVGDGYLGVDARHKATAVRFWSFTPLTRRARACPGHPRRAEAANLEGLLQQRGVDGRDKPGQDAERFCFT